MKHFILIFCLFFVLPVFAQAVYCPQKIHCLESNNLSSCTFEQSSKNYWDKIYPAQVLAGVYNNSYVSAPYYTHDTSTALCVYTHQDQYKTLTLKAKPESHLEMFIQDHELWHREETWWECAPKYPEACPLQEQAALTIYNQSLEFITLSNGSKIKPGKFIRLYQDDLNFGLLDLFSESNFIARIQIDLESRLEIREIIIGAAGYWGISQLEGYNAVRVEDHE